MGTRQSLKRSGPLSDTERNLIAQVVLDQPGELKPSQVNGLAKALRRSKEAIKSAIEDARDKLRENADFYVTVHRQATERALAHGTVNGYEAAQKGAQWALERISGEGARIIEKQGGNDGPVGPRVMIGIRVGGLDATKEKPIEATVTEIP